MEYTLEPSATAIVFWIVTGFWCLEAGIFRSQRYGEPQRNSGSVWGLALAIVASLSICGLFYHFRWGFVDGAWGVALRAGGLTLYGLGVGLRLWAARCLGRWFSRDVRVAAEQTLVSTGPYRWIRHPLYLGLFTAVCGIGLTMATPLGVFLGAVPLYAAVRWRMVAEEEAMEAALGDAYRAWKRTRFRFLPGVY